MRIDEDDTLIFDSGLTVYPNYGAIGISSSLCVFDGTQDDIFDMVLQRLKKMILLIT